jgi:hypothetical protein
VKPHMADITLGVTLARDASVHAAGTGFRVATGPTQLPFSE